MATKQAEQIQKLSTDMALVQQEQKNQAKLIVQTRKDILERMDGFSFVSQKDYDRDQRDQADINKENADDIAELKKMVYAGGLKTVNGLFSNVSKMIITILSIAIIAAIVYFAVSVFPAIGGVR